MGGATLSAPEIVALAEHMEAGLRGSVNRRVAYVSSNDKEAFESL
jgi:hypothetical protein